MRSKKTTTVQIIVDEDGVSRVRLCGQSWEDQSSANAVFKKISHLVDQIDQTLKNPELQVTH